MPRSSCRAHYRPNPPWIFMGVSPCYHPRQDTTRAEAAVMTTSPPVSFSHFGIYVTDLARMEDFYTRVLGLLVSDRGQVPGGSNLVFLSRDPDEHPPIVLATGRPPGVEVNVGNQISFKLPALADLK